MAAVRPFRGLRYSLRAVGDISRVLAPPYDVISEAERQQLAARSPYNVVHLTLGDQPVDMPAEQRDYSRAAELLQTWRQQGVLRYDGGPRVYVYEQLYEAPPPISDMIRRRGLIVAVQLEPLGQGSILPHEGTLDEPKRDRLKSLRQTLCQFSQIFGLYEDRDKIAEAAIGPLLSEPTWKFKDEQGVTHSFWVVADAEAARAVQEALAEREIVIADGHHRYETSWAFRQEMRAQHGPGPWDYITMFLCNVVHRSLTILPSHRLIRRLPQELLDGFEYRASQLFDLEYVTMPRSGDIRPAVELLLECMNSRGALGTVFGAYWGRGYAIAMHLRENHPTVRQIVAELPPAQRQLDLAILHAVVIRHLLGQTEDIAKAGTRGNIYFERDAFACIREVLEGRAAMALLCNPTRVEDVMRVARAGERMPQKGTYFWPKPLAGLVLYDLRPGAPSLE